MFHQMFCIPTGDHGISEPSAERTEIMFFFDEQNHSMWQLSQGRTGCFMMVHNDLFMNFRKFLTLGQIVLRCLFGFLCFFCGTV